MRTVWYGRSGPNRAAQAIRRAVRHAPTLLAALGWVCLVRAGLSLASHRRLRRAFLPPRRLGPADRDAAARVGWAVRHAARLVPRATCLTQALAAQIMLARRGVPSVLQIGVDRAADSTGSARFEAHAWLEVDGLVLVGGTADSLARYARIASHGPVPT